MKKIKTLLILSTLLFCGKSFSQTWTPHNVGTIDDIYDVSFPTNDSGYVVYGPGQMQKTFDGANSWSVVASPAFASSICFISGMTGFVGGDSSIYRTTNAGSSWTQVMHDNRVNFVSIYFIDDLNGFAGGFGFANDSLRLYKTSNGGITWVYVSAMPAFVPDEAFYFFNSTSGFWANNFDIYSTTNGGVSFSSVYTSQNDMKENISFPNVDTGYAVGYYGELVKSTDGGANWSLITYPGTANYDIHFIDGRKGFICGGNGFNSGYIMQTSNGGTSWTPTYTSVYSFFCMDFPSDTVGYAGGQSGLIIRYSSAPNGIAQNSNAHSINVFPNPSNGNFQLTGNFPSNSQLHIYNLLGEEIIQPLELSEGNQTIPVESGLAEGIYVYRIISGKNVLQEEKLVIVR
jgi:photosystem II stability/assembly factor-like uncharacterized protein